ncbi:uncharacterized protein LOC144881425 isoform X2 [Branchiostoma floridae x Branchiostoma japonicum]
MVRSHVACKMATLDSNQVTKAANALVNFHQERGTKKKGKKDLLEDEAAMPVFMQFSVKRIPKEKNQKYLIKLPHSIEKPTEVCLFTRDRKNLEPELPTTEMYYMDLLKKHGVTCVTEVISYKKLSKEYKQFESKLRLLKSFDLFLSDRGVTRMLPSHLGKHFYKAKKFPIDVNLEKKDLKPEFQRVLGSTRCTVTGHGSCSSVMVGTTSMTAEQVTENVEAVAKELGDKIEFGWPNIKSVSIKSQKSPALPVYVNVEPLQLPSETIAAWREERLQNQEERQSAKKRKNRKRKRKPKQADKSDEAKAGGKTQTPEQPGESKKQKKKKQLEGKENAEGKEGPAQGKAQGPKQESAVQQKKQAAAQKGAQKTVSEPMKTQNGQDTKDKKGKKAGKEQKQAAETAKAVGVATKQEPQKKTKLDKVQKQEEKEEDAEDVMEEEDEDEDEEMYSDESELEFESDDEEEEDSFIDDEAEEGEETDDSDAWELMEEDVESGEEEEEADEDDDEPTPPKKRKVVEPEPAASPKKNVKATPKSTQKAAALKKNTPKSTPSNKPQTTPVSAPASNQGAGGKPKTPKATPKQKATPKAAVNIPQKATPKAMATPKASSTPMPTTPMSGAWQVTPGQKAGGKTPVGKKAGGKGSKPATPMSAKGKRKQN